MTIPTHFHPPEQAKRGDRLGIAALYASLLLAAAFLMDGAVIDWTNAHQVRWIKRLAGFISEAGDWLPVSAFGAAALAWAWLVRRRRWVRVLSWMFVSSLIAGAIANPLRAIFGRTRPNAHVDAGWYGMFDHGHWIAARNQYHSFPSGHSAVIFAFFAPLVISSQRFRRLAIGVICLVAGSRIYLNVHHLSDVTAGFLIGAFSVSAAGRMMPHLTRASKLALRRLSKNRLQELRESEG